MRSLAPTGTAEFPTLLERLSDKATAEYYNPYTTFEWPKTIPTGDFWNARQPATDPFFRKDGPRAALQLLAPVKEEYVHNDGTAVASMNHHRNFFGERCAISYAGKPAFTGCVAFGLERWVHVLAERFDGDLESARKAVRRARVRP